MAENKKNPLCIVAAQRSGTTALQSALAASEKFHDFGEIFQTNDARRHGSFFDFAEQKKLLVTDMATEPGVNAIVAEYLDHISEISGDDVPLIDIKHNSWHALRSFWGYLTQEPKVLEALRRRGSSFIFVMRKDLAAQIVSEYIARSANQWHNLDESAVTEAITINPNRAVWQARMIMDSEKLLYPLLKSTGRVFPVYYEDLYEESGQVSGQLSTWIEKQCGLDFQGPLWPGIQQNKVSKKKSVENLDEVYHQIAELIEREGRLEI